jgi:hypothetical protein
MAEQIHFISFTPIPFGSFGGAYTQVNQPAIEPFQAIIFSNSLNQDVLISFDGVNNHLYLVAGQSQTVGSQFLMRGFNVGYPAGTDIWIKNAGVAPTSGNLFLERYYYA